MCPFSGIVSPYPFTVYFDILVISYHQDFTSQMYIFIWHNQGFVESALPSVYFIGVGV